MVTASEKSTSYAVGLINTILSKYPSTKIVSHIVPYDECKDSPKTCPAAKYGNDVLGAWEAPIRQG